MTVTYPKGVERGFRLAADERDAILDSLAVGYTIYVKKTAAGTRFLYVNRPRNTDDLNVRMASPAQLSSGGVKRFFTENPGEWERFQAKFGDGAMLTVPGFRSAASGYMREFQDGGAKDDDDKDVTVGHFTLGFIPAGGPDPNVGLRRPGHHSSKIKANAKHELVYWYENKWWFIESVDDEVVIGTSFDGILAAGASVDDDPDAVIALVRQAKDKKKDDDEEKDFVDDLDELADAANKGGNKGGKGGKKRAGNCHRASPTNTHGYWRYTCAETTRGTTAGGYDEHFKPTPLSKRWSIPGSNPLTFQTVKHPGSMDEFAAGITEHESDVDDVVCFWTAGANGARVCRSVSKTGLTARALGDPVPDEPVVKGAPSLKDLAALAGDRRRVGAKRLYQLYFHGQAGGKGKVADAAVPKGIVGDKDAGKGGRGDLREFCAEIGHLAGAKHGTYGIRQRIAALKNQIARAKAKKDGSDSNRTAAAKKTVANMCKLLRERSKCILSRHTVRAGDPTHNVDLATMQAAVQLGDGDLEACDLPDDFAHAAPRRRPRADGGKKKKKSQPPKPKLKKNKKKATDAVVKKKPRRSGRLNRDKDVVDDAEAQTDAVVKKPRRSGRLNKKAKDGEKKQRAKPQPQKPRRSCRQQGRPPSAPGAAPMRRSRVHRRGWDYEDEDDTTSEGTSTGTSDGTSEDEDADYYAVDFSAPSEALTAADMTAEELPVDPVTFATTDHHPVADSPSEDAIPVPEDLQAADMIVWTL